MPEMLKYFGRAFTVSNRVERACDAVSRARRMPDTVMLEDLRCDGAAHGGCQAGCRLYWKERWLRRVASDEVAQFSPDEAFEQLRALALDHVRPDDGQTRYTCQVTEFIRASELIPFWSARSFLREVTSGNVSLRTFLRVITGIARNEPRRRRRGDAPFPSGTGGVAPAATPALHPGSSVRVRPAAEIAETLDERGKLRGLWFDREMLPYCGQTATVKAKVERFIDENSGEMVELKTDCYILDGVVCRGEISDGRWFCCRQIYPWWRGAWLEPDADAAS